VAPPASKPAKPAPRLSPPDDPAAGQFSLEDATAGLTGTGALKATIETDLGTLSCDLYEKDAPITVANFVGLARGVRPWKKGGEWVKTPLYDGTVFHRVVKGFMIQGGDPAGNGSGGPGYMIKNEIIPGAKHERGILSMARRPDPDSAGSQFFLMDGRAPHLDGGYAIFGKCGPDSIIEKLAGVPVQGEQSVTPTKIKSVKITRGS
jgi:peptidyl-prolyl cis-trans isomerase A (cyclophilin A)